MSNSCNIVSEKVCQWALLILLPFAIFTTGCTPSPDNSDPLTQQLQETPTSIFEEPLWGESLSEIAGHYQDGQVFRVDDDETHYRVLAQAYGQSRALITFCVREELGLHLVVIEFVHSEGQIDDQTGDYTRPTLNEGQAVHHIVAEKLTNLYGPANHVSEEPNRGGLMVFAREHGEFIRLDSTPAGRDQLNVTVWQVNRGIDVIETNKDKAIIAGLWKIPTSTWAKVPVFDVNWGMGPGDVSDKYRDLTPVLHSPEKPIQTYRADTFIEGNVGINFEFFDGQLIGIVISPTQHSEANWGEQEREQLWASWDFWITRIQEILQEKYGAPVSGRLELKYGRDEGPDAPDNAWIWETDTTGILLRLAGRIPILEYRELKSTQSREDAERKYEEQREAAKKDKF